MSRSGGKTLPIGSTRPALVSDPDTSARARNIIVRKQQQQQQTNRRKSIGRSHRAARRAAATDAEERSLHC